MTRIWPIMWDLIEIFAVIREYSRSISSNLTLSNYESVEIRSIRLIRVLFLNQKSVLTDQTV